MPLVHCPTCGKTFDSQQSGSMPFCSPRCRLVDLNRWLSEENRVPILRDEDEEEQRGKSEGEDSEDEEPTH